MRRALAQRAALPFPLDLRLVDPVDKVAPQARPARQLAWMRSPEPLGDDPALHRCVFAYGSDFALLETALLPHATAVPSSKLTAASIGASAALRWQRSQTDEKVKDHSIWFHQPFRADEWLLYEMESPAASGALHGRAALAVMHCSLRSLWAGGRGLSFGRLFNAAGQLVASVAQEGLIRHASNAEERAAAEPPRARL
jgi:acyl-CoA thioesterase-2